MDTPKISEMWADLKQTSKLSKGSVLSSCEPELQELMRQIDAMVQAKRLEWEREKQTLQARLEVRQQEYNIQRATLQQKHTEVGQLRAQVEVLEKSQREASAQYEMQLSSVRTEVDHIKKEYEKLHKRYNQRREKATKSVGGESSSADAKLLAENKKLTSKLEELKRKSKDWEQEKRLLQHEIESLESQNKTMDEKLNLVQQQSASYQSQLDRRREMLDSTELNMKSQVQQLESQLQRARDMINSQDTQLSRLRSSYDEALQGQRRALEEKEEVESELRTSQQAARRFEEELHTNQVNFSAQEEVLRRSQSEIKRLSTQINHLQDELSAKDSLVQSMEREAQLPDQNSQMHEELRHTKAQCKTLKKSEQNLQHEVVQLKEQLDHLKRECTRLNKQLGNKVTEMKILETSEIKKLKNELSDLHGELSVSKGKYQGEVQGLKEEVARLRSELQKRGSASVTLSERILSLEKDLRERTDAMEKKEAELRVSSAQLEALRLENRHLRRSALNMTSASNRSLNETGEETEVQLKELQAAYDASLGVLQNQNRKLSNDVSHLRRQLQNVEEITDHKIQEALNESYSSGRNTDQRFLDDAQSRAHDQLDDLKNKQESLVHSYEEKISQLKSQVSSLEKELDSRNSTMTRLGLEHEAMSEFVSGVDHIVNSPNQSHLSYRSERSGGAGVNTDNEEDHDSVDSAEVATANFLAEQDRRTAELERRLNSHIEDLKIATEGALVGGFSGPFR